MTVKMLHMLETDYDIVCLEDILKDLSKENREAIINTIVKLQDALWEYEPSPSWDGTCPGCGRKDC